MEYFIFIIVLKIIHTLEFIIGIAVGKTFFIIKILFSGFEYNLVYISKLIFCCWQKVR